jgi:hypothetical protein
MRSSSLFSGAISTTPNRPASYTRGKGGEDRTILGPRLVTEFTSFRGQW